MSDKRLGAALRKAKDCLMKKRYRNVRAILAPLLRTHPTDERILSLLDRVLFAESAQAGHEAARIQRLVEAGQFTDALAAAQIGLVRFPDAVNIWLSAALAARGLSAPDPARKFIAMAVELAPHKALLWSVMAEILADGSDHSGAAEALEQAVALEPGSSAHRRELGYHLLKLARHDEAATVLRQAVKLDNQDPDAMSWLGLAQLAGGDAKAAVISLEKASRLAPSDATILNNLGNALTALDRLDEAARTYGRAVALDPDFMLALTHKLFFSARIGDWACHQDFARVKDRIGIGQDSIPPWALLSFEDDPAHALERAASHARGFSLQRPSLPAAARPAERIRIGYFSNDFHDHATMRLFSDVLQNHDPARFQISLFVMNPPADDARLTALRKSADHLHQIHDMSDQSVVALARAENIQIAVDLKGYTNGARPALFHSGLAPLQVNYLGYPGSLGSGAWDYIIADPVVIPRTEREYYRENVIFMPHSYQPNNRLGDVGVPPDRPQDHGLPSSGIILCSFNDPYKIGPREFDIWMRLLARQDDAVLWLFEGNKWIAPALRAEAARRGIDPARLIFAPPMAHARHLQRLPHADLMLDSFNCNAHTTGSDALRCGVPVLTLAGRQFSARVGASLLNAVGLPELITSCETAYEEKAASLIEDRDSLADLKWRLHSALKIAPLFDPIRYTRNLETAYAAMWSRFGSGAGPEDIWVEDIATAQDRARIQGVA